MFFEGSLQEGISTALQQSKQVVCFVTDDGSESQQWENEFLTHDSIRSGLEAESVILRLVAGSEESGYLEALFPLPKKPTVVVIQNGQLKEYIASGTSKEEFIRRLGGTVQPSVPPSQPTSSSAPPPTTPAANITQSEHHALPQSSRSGGDSLYDDDIQPTVTQAGSPAPTQVVSSHAAEEEKRAADKKKGKTKAQPEDDTRIRADERHGQTPENPEQAHANEIRHRKHQANEERKRILKRIEDDKRARKEREAEERNARRLLGVNADTDGAGTPAESISLSQRSSRAGQSDHCNLQVRLLDGSSIRTRFPSDKTLGRDVRKWIDEERTDGDAPYSFRIVLTPLPNKAIEPQEESGSLLSLGLAPSATLILTPVKYSAAYGHAGGILAPFIGGFSYLYGVIFRFLGGIFALFFGGGGGAGGSAEQRGNDNIPLENLRARRDAQLYNGNSLNFEPRNEDGDEDNTR
ncbi:hypothetical protein F4861DRAFT_218349 [Xylaria intraflava]|nr:hypothetical protein F4861DRAFT_218349 [Xylaria intraflava]